MSPKTRDSNKVKQLLIDSNLLTLFFLQTALVFILPGWSLTVIQESLKPHSVKNGCYCSKKF